LGELFLIVPLTSTKRDFSEF